MRGGRKKRAIKECDRWKQAPPITSCPAVDHASMREAERIVLTGVGKEAQSRQSDPALLEEAPAAQPVARQPCTGPHCPEALSPLVKVPAFCCIPVSPSGAVCPLQRVDYWFPFLLVRCPCRPPSHNRRSALRCHVLQSRVPRRPLGG